MGFPSEDARRLVESTAMAQPPQQPPFGAPPPGPPWNPPGPPPGGALPPYAAPMQAQAPVAAPAARRRVKPAVGMSRPKGLLLLAIGLGLGAFNVYSLMHDGHYYPKSLLIAPVAALVGIFAI